MAIQALAAITATLLLCGCSSLPAQTSSTGRDNISDIPLVDVDVEVKELPGLFQVLE